MGSIGGMSPGGDIALGIIVGLMSTAVQSLGLTLQRKSHILEDEKVPNDIRRPPHHRRRWQVGMGMFIVANLLGSTVQISTLPLPVLSTLQASGLVFNSICATLILGEPFTRWSLWGTLLVCTGAVLIAVFGAIPAPAHTLDELLTLLGRRAFVVWMSLQAVFVISIAVAVDVVNGITTLSQHPRFRLMRGLTYGCISGILSAHSLLVAKSAVELIVRTIADGKNQFVRWQSWVLVLSLIFLALCQLYYLHRGLKLVSTSVLYPLVFCIYNIIAILDGLIYFHQTDLISTLHACLIALGTVILLSGVLALSWRLSDEQHPPAVGQSTLAPGLGLVEDTDGEEEEEDLLLGAGRPDEENQRSTSYSYQTFGGDEDEEDTAGVISTEPPYLPAVSRRKCMAPSIKTTGSRWDERAEIWGELQDHDTPNSPSPRLARQRSSTLPMLSESTLLLPSRRHVSGGGPSTASADAPRRAFRRRRKSTGFPGFQARKTMRRKSSSGVQDTLSGMIWRLGWWKNTDSVEEGAGLQPLDSPAVESPRWFRRRFRDLAIDGRDRDGGAGPSSPNRDMTESPSKNKRGNDDEEGDPSPR